MSYFVERQGRLFSVNSFFTESPVDMNDPESAVRAFPVRIPAGLSKEAELMMEYLDDTAWLFIYNGRLVLTDESLWLTDYNRDGYFGGPRWTGDTVEELDAWLAAEYEDLEESEE